MGTGEGMRGKESRRCLAETHSGTPQKPYLYCTLPEGHDDAHEAWNLRTGEMEKAWSKAPWELNGDPA